MSEQVEKKQSIQNLERVKSLTLPSYEEASAYREASKEALKDTPTPPAKIKIFARCDGTFDVVWYKKIEATTEVVKVSEKIDADGRGGMADFKRVVHGQRSKDRKRPHRDASVKK